MRHTFAAGRSFHSSPLHNASTCLPHHPFSATSDASSACCVSEDADLVADASGVETSGVAAATSSLGGLGLFLLALFLASLVLTPPVDQVSSDSPSANLARSP